MSVTISNLHKNLSTKKQELERIQDNAIKTQMVWLKGKL